MERAGTLPRGRQVKAVMIGEEVGYSVSSSHHVIKQIIQVQNLAKQVAKIVRVLRDDLILVI